MSTLLQNPHLEGGSFTWQAGPVGVLLLHGFTATTSEVRPLGQMLHERGYTVSGPLLPGFGTTPEDANRVRWKDWVEAASLAYRELYSRCSTVFVGGESLGGLLALYLASVYPDAPGVLTYAPALKLRSPVLPLLAPLLAPFVATFRKRPRSSPITDERWQGYTVYPVSAGVQVFKLAQQVRARLPAIRQPLLVLQGRQDYSMHPSVPDLLARESGSEIVEIHWMEKSTHCVILDCELEQVAGLTLDFMQRALLKAGSMPGSTGSSYPA